VAPAEVEAGTCACSVRAALALRRALLWDKRDVQLAESEDVSLACPLPDRINRALSILSILHSCQSPNSDNIEAISSSETAGSFDIPVNVGTTFAD